MQLSRLKTLIAIQKSGSFSAAANIVNLSHSAVSIQMRQLEEQTGLTLFEKGKRPATLTPIGRQFLLKSMEVMGKVDELASIGGENSTIGSISIGFVPTTLQTILPIALGELRQRFPDLQVSVISGLSDDLAGQVAAKTLDFAFLTAPTQPKPELQMSILAEEPLAIITPHSVKLPKSIYDLFLTMPFIAFSRTSWLGQQIEAHLAHAGVPFEPKIELDSIDAVENLVALGHGISIVPMRALASAHTGLRYSNTLGDPAPTRRLTLVSHHKTTRGSVRNVIVDIVGFNISK
jgi:DNA-binding transcriptional LysR family regulator